MSKGHKGGVEADILFLTFLLQLPCGKYHFNSSVTLLEATLTLQQQLLLKVLCQMVQQDPGQAFPYNRKQGDASMDITSLPASFSLVQVTNHADFLLLPHGLELLCELPDELWATSCIHFCWNGVTTRSFATGHSPDCFLYFSLAREFNQGVADLNLRQMGNWFIVDDRWPTENTVKLFYQALKNLSLPIMVEP